MKVLKFGAVWCPGCLVMRPRWEKIEKENDWLKTEYFDVDEFPDMIEKYDLQEYPTFIWFDKNEQEIERTQGEVSEVELVDLINKHKGK
jgi:thiol-disulfide isomerase/thioredoxin